MFEKIYIGAVSILSLGILFLIITVLMKYLIQWQEISIFSKYIFGLPDAL